PPSITAMHEFVVPKSTPITVAIINCSWIRLSALTLSKELASVFLYDSWFSITTIWDEIRLGQETPIIVPMRHNGADALGGMAQFLSPSLSSLATLRYLLPGLITGRAARSGGRLSGANVSTPRASKLKKGIPKWVPPFERSTAAAMARTNPP